MYELIDSRVSRRAAMALLGGAVLSPLCRAAEASVVQGPMRAALTEWLDAIAARGLVSGASLAVFCGDQPPLVLRSGLADREQHMPTAEQTIYRIYSMTKPVTTAAMMTLVEQGKVKLDQPIAEFLPEFARPRVFVRFEGDEPITEAASTPITVRHLLTHTAGFSESFNDGIEPTAQIYKRKGLIAGQWYRLGTIKTLAEFSRAIAEIPLAAQPGARWIYGTSLDVAGRVIEVAADMDFGEYVRQRILVPLKMRDTDFQLTTSQQRRLAALYVAGPQGLMRVPDDQIPAWGTTSVIPTGGAGLFSTLADYGRFARMLLGSGQLDGVRVLERESVDAMMTDQLGTRLGPEPLSSAARFGLGGEVKGLGFGLGGTVMVDPRAADQTDSLGEYAWGGAASTTFCVNRRRALCAVLMTQKLPSGIHPLRDEFRKIVYRHLR